MSFNISGGALVTSRTKLTSNAVATVFTAKSRTIVLSVTCVENSGTTPNLTVEVYDGTTSFYLRKAVVMTAGTAFIFNEPFEVFPGGVIRVTSSDASGHVDAHVSYINPVAAASGR